MQDDTPTLIEKLTSGDPDAIEHLLSRHMPGLRAFIRLRAGPVVRARESESDLVQSVCREVLRGIERFDYQGDAAFKNWLFKAALRKIKKKLDVCAGEDGGGFQTVSLVIAGATGRATSAKLVGAFADPKVSACVAKVIIHHARFIRFKKTSQKVRSPLVLR